MASRSRRSIVASIKRQQEQAQEQERLEQERFNLEQEKIRLANEKLAEERQRKEEKARLDLVRSKAKKSERTQRKKAAKNVEKLRSLGIDTTLTRETGKVARLPQQESLACSSGSDSGTGFDDTEAQNLDENAGPKDAVDFRSPIICVLGHVDTGKTKLLDNLRRSKVQSNEFRGITQQIGATNLGLEVIQDRTKHVTSTTGSVNIPGLLIIDTPGHEAFSNLRSRGSTVCDLAILVVDVMHGIEQQTLESIDLLKQLRLPFVVALNKIDRVNGFKSDQDLDIRESLSRQADGLYDFERRCQNIQYQFAAKAGLNVKLFWELDDLDSENYEDQIFPMVPTSAITGDGIGNLISLCVQFCQEKLGDKITFSETPHCSVLDVKRVQGVGTTVDCILTQGRLSYGDKIILATTDQPQVTKIKALHVPHGNRDIRVADRAGTGTVAVKKTQAAKGVRIVTSDKLESIIAGTTLKVLDGNCDCYQLQQGKQEIEEEVRSRLDELATSPDGVGVHLQANTIGALEALSALFKKNKVPVASCNIGPIQKRDVLKASLMFGKDPRWAVIVGFEAELAMGKAAQQSSGISSSNFPTIISERTVYHCLDKIKEHERKYIEESKKTLVQEGKVSFPCILDMIKDSVVHRKSPLIFGVRVNQGQIRVGQTFLTARVRRAPELEGQQKGQVVEKFVRLGKVTGIRKYSEEKNVKPEVMQQAKSGDLVTIRVDAQGLTAPAFGSSFDFGSMIVSDLNRQRVDLLKEWYRDEMTKSDWKCVNRLKEILRIPDARQNLSK